MGEGADIGVWCVHGRVVRFGRAMVHVGGGGNKTIWRVQPVVCLDTFSETRWRLGSFAGAGRRMWCDPSSRGLHCGGLGKRFLILRKNIPFFIKFLLLAGEEGGGGCCCVYLVLMLDHINLIHLSQVSAFWDAA